MRRLVPEPAEDASLDDLYGVHRAPLGDRPWVGVCMVASLDGSTVVDGRSGGLSTEEDTAVLLRLRRAADVILVGAGTVRAEGYRPPASGQRIGVVTRSGSVDVAAPLFTTGSGFLVMAEDGAAAPDGPGGPTDVVRAGFGEIDLRLALRRLDQVVDPPSFVQVEGGPRLNGALIDAGCVDELDLTMSPHLVGGDGPRLAVGGPARLDRFRLAHLAVGDGAFVYTRWLRDA